MNEPAWRKSSHSGYNGNCVEVAWRKSSYSGAGNCTEVAAMPGPDGYVIAVRDSKDPAGYVIAVRDSKDPAGPVLEFSGAAWARFVARVKAGLRAG